MHLLRPYPDELLGSLLHRASRQFGLSAPQLTRSLSGRAHSYYPIFITRCVGFADACGMDFTDFLRSHTLLPYMTAFMQEGQQQAVFASFHQGRRSGYAITNECIIADALPYLRFCRECRASDLLLYGEAYWHRSHQLPAVVFCLKHGRPLQVSNLQTIDSTETHTPADVSFAAVTNHHLPFDTRYHIAKLSAAALYGVPSTQDWPGFYMKWATSLGYMKGDSCFDPISLVRDMKDFYGPTFLRKVGLTIDVKNLDSWPALLFRRSNRPSTTLKNILLQAFLTSAPNLSQKGDRQ